MAETMITSSADLERAFQRNPYAEREEHLQAIALLLQHRVGNCFYKDIAKKLNVQISVRSASQNDSCHWLEPVILVTYYDGTRHLCYPCVEFKAEMSGKYSATGRLRMTVGNYGNRRSFPPNKDGKFNYESAAELLAGEISARLRIINDDATKDSNEELVERLKKAHDLPRHSSLVSATCYNQYSKTTNVAPTGMVYVSVGTKLLNEEKANKLLAFLKEFSA